MAGKNKRLSVLIVILEITILFVGVLMSFTTTYQTVQYDMTYAAFYAFTALGLLMIGGLIFALKKKIRLIPLIGAICIFIYLYGAGFGAIACTLRKQRFRHLELYKGKTVTVMFDGEEYRWNGESVSYSGNDMEYVESNDSRYAVIDGEKSTRLLYRSTDPDCVYICIYSGATGEYLELKKQ